MTADSRPAAPTRVRGRAAFVSVSALAIVAVWAWLYLRGLGDFPLQMWDESRYAVPARNMLASGDWLTPRLQVNTHSQSLAESVRLVKPPLLYWMQAVAMLALGETTFAARLPSALATLGAAGLVYRIAAHTYDDRAGLAGALTFLVVPQVLSGTHGGRGAVPDAPLLLFGSLFVWLTWRGRERPRLLVPAGVAAGLAVLTKGFAAGVFVIAVLPLVGSAWQAYLERWRFVLAGVASTLVVALPWHVYALATHGFTFVDQYVVQAVLKRVAGGPPSYYADPLLPFMNYPYLRKFAIPPLRFETPVFQVGIVLAVLVLAWLVRRDGRDRHLDKLALLWWTAAVPLTFIVGGGNKAWYIMPMHVPGAALIGIVPAAIADGTAAEMARAAFARVGYEGRVGTADVRRRIRVLLPADRTRDRVTAGAYVLVCVLLALAIALPTAGSVSDWQQTDREQRQIGLAIAAETTGDETIYVAEGIDRSTVMTVPFYADRTYRRASLDRIQADSTVGYAIVPIDRVDEFDAEHRVVERGEEIAVALVAFVDRSGQP